MTESAIFAIYSGLRCICCSPGNGPNHNISFRRRSAGPALPHEAVIPDIISGNSGTEPALRIPVVERAAATYGPTRTRFQYGVCDSGGSLDRAQCNLRRQFGLTEEYGAAALIERSPTTI